MLRESYMASMWLARSHVMSRPDDAEDEVRSETPASPPVTSWTFFPDFWIRFQTEARLT